MTREEISRLSKGDLIKFYYDAPQEEFWCLAVFLGANPESYDRYEFYMNGKITRFGLPSLRMYAEAL